MRCHRAKAISRFIVLPLLALSAHGCFGPHVVTYIIINRTDKRFVDKDGKFEIAPQGYGYDDAVISGSPIGEGAFRLALDGKPQWVKLSDEAEIAPNVVVGQVWPDSMVPPPNADHP